VIRLTRGPEPNSLPPVRKQELDRVRPIAAKGRVTRRDIGTKYRVVRPDLRRQQHCKCCYCERDVELKGEAVEHYRPAGAVLRYEGAPREEGYWWLAWTWDNLLFVCNRCNSDWKREYFPLAPGSKPLRRRGKPPGDERPLLINPYDVDPLDHIQYRRLALASGRAVWIPGARDGSELGRTTVEVVGLNRPDLRDLYAKHARRMEPDLAVLRAALAAGNEEDVGSAWEHCVDSWLHAEDQFAGLSYDILDWACSASERAKWGLNLPRPF
jgi:hypothetical protein